MSVLRFENVSKQYPGGHAALEDVSFEVAEGEMLFVTGHSGAGKSTLLKLIHLSERPSRGAVVFGGRNLLKVRGGRIPLHRREVGAVYQDHRLLTDRTVMENVSLPLILRGDRRGDIGKRVPPDKGAERGDGHDGVGQHGQPGGRHVDVHDPDRLALQIVRRRADDQGETAGEQHHGEAGKPGDQAAGKCQEACWIGQIG